MHDILHYHSARETIPQSTSIGTPLINITATDGDQPNTPNSQITFSLQDSSIPFTIDATSGLLSTGPGVQAQVYDIIVIASDNGDAPLSSTGSITIDVAPPNTFPPGFPADLAFSIVENDSPTDSVFDIMVTDGDAGMEGEVQLMLLPSEFSVNFTLQSGNPGRLFYRSGPGFDRETISNFTLSVRAVDQGNVRFRMTSEATLLVSISDTNDNPPVFVGEPYEAMVGENATPGTIVVTVSATDADEGPPIRYNLTSSGDEFGVDEDTGNVLVVGTKTQPFFIISIDAFDGIFTVTTYVNITVIEENDNAPVFSPPLPLTVLLPEDTDIGALLLNVSAFDGDSGVSAETQLSLEQVGITFGRTSYPEPNEFYVFLNEQVDFEVS